MSNDRFKFRVWDDTHKEYLPLCDCKLDARNGKIVKQSLFQENRYIIEQCTGLRDKNGKLIYEGDCCRVYDEKTGQFVSDTLYKVVFGECLSGGCACLCFQVYHGGKLFGVRPIFANGLPNIEIIGNIHEMEVRQ